MTWKRMPIEDELKIPRIEPKPSPATLPLWHVWIEGYAATGEHGRAQFVGAVHAATFEEACKKLHNPRWGNYGHDRKGRPTYWACRLYDNEADARKEFG